MSKVVNCDVDTGPSDSSNASSDNLDIKLKEALDDAVSNSEKLIKDKVRDIQNIVSQDNEDDELPDTETFEVTITSSRNVYEVLKLLVLLDSDANDLDAYV